MALAYSTRVRQRFLLRTSTWSRAQKDSITALSKQSPTQPIDGNSPDRRARRVNARDVNCTPWSEWMISPEPGSGCRFEMAIPSALVTSVEVCVESIDQPTTRRLNVSSTTQQ